MSLVRRAKKCLTFSAHRYSVKVSRVVVVVVVAVVVAFFGGGICGFVCVTVHLTVCVRDQMRCFVS